MKTICTKCGQSWNISVHKNLRVPYVCPHCYCKTRVKKTILIAVGFLVSCLLSSKCSDIAAKQRGYQIIIGGEDFIPLMYLAVVAFIKSVMDIKKEST